MQPKATIQNMYFIWYVAQLHMYMHMYKGGFQTSQGVAIARAST